MLINQNPAHKPCTCTASGTTHTGIHSYTLACTGAEIITR